MIRSLRAKIFGFVILLTCIILAGLFLFRQSNLHRMSQLIEEREHENTDLLQMSIRVLSSNLNFLVHDYSLWDEMVDFISSQDKEWARDNLGSPQIYKAHALWVCGLDFSVIYSVNTLDSNASWQLPISTDVLRHVMMKTPQCHFYLQTDRGILEFQGSPVVPSADEARVTPPQGYFFAGRYLSQDYLDEISSLTSNQIAIEPPSEVRVTRTDSQFSCVVYSSLPLLGSDGLPVAYLHASLEDRNLLESMQLMQWQYALAAVFTLAIFSLITIFLLRHVSHPLSQVLRSLKTENHALLNKLRKDSSEFANVASLIEEFFRQKELLETEISHRQSSESDLRNANSKLEAIFGALPDLFFVVRPDCKIVDFHISNSEDLWIPLEMLIGNKLFCALPEKAAEKIATHVAKVCATQQPDSVEYSLLFPNGERDFEARINPYWNGDAVVAIRNVTKQNHDEEALRQSESTHRLVMDVIPDLILRLDLEGKVTYASPACCAMLGLLPDELIGENFIDLFHLDCVEESIEVFESALRSPIIQTMTSQVHASDGTKLWLETNLKAFRDPKTGKPREVFAVSRDVTERRKAEQEQILLQTITEIASYADSLDTMLNGTLSQVAIFLNTTSLYLALYDEDTQEISYPFWIDEQNPSPEPHIIQNSLEDLVIRNGQSLHVSRDICEQMMMMGEIDPILIPPCSWMGVPLRVKSNSVGALVIQNYETTNLFDSETERVLSLIASDLAHVIERKRAEQKLRESEERYRDLFENAGDLIQIVNPAGQIMYANRSWHETLEYTAEEASQMFVWDIVHEDCLDEFMQLFERLTHGYSVGLIKTKFIKKSGETILVDGSSSPCSADGDSMTVRGIFRDVTEQRRLEEEILQTEIRAKHLEGIQQTTVTLQHEINNPLTAVLASAELLEIMLPDFMEHPSPEKAKYLCASASGIVNLSIRISDVVHKLKNVYRPMVKYHPVNNENVAEMIDITNSE